MPSASCPSPHTLIVCKTRVEKLQLTVHEGTASTWKNIRPGAPVEFRVKLGSSTGGIQPLFDGFSFQFGDVDLIIDSPAPKQPPKKYPHGRPRL